MRSALRRLDLYVVGEVAWGQATGVAMFAGLVFCVTHLNEMIRLWARQAYPLPVIAQISVLQLPFYIYWTLPVAIIFGTLLGVGRLNSDGEITAMRAAGISLQRIGRPVLLLGCAGTALLFLLNDVVVPRCSSRAQRLIQDYGTRFQARSGYQFAVTKAGKLQRQVFAVYMDPRTLRLEEVVVVEVQEDHVVQIVQARKARWEGTWFVLEDVQVTENALEGPRTWQAAALRQDVGRSAEEMRAEGNHPDLMSAAQIKRYIARLRELGADPQKDIAPYVQQLAVRRALPWCAIGFVLVSVPLAVRPVRTSKGVSLGLAVLIFFPYYVATYTPQVIGKHGGVPVMLTAWLGNVLLYMVGAALFFDRRR